MTRDDKDWLAGKIMNIPVDEKKLTRGLYESIIKNHEETAMEHSYKLGHRDARHAAAGIVLESTAPPLISTNPHLRDPEKRERDIERSVKSSAKIEE